MATSKLYDRYADEGALQKQTDNIIEMLSSVEAGVKRLSNLGIKLDASKSVKETEKLKTETEETTHALNKQQQQLVKMANNLAALRTEEAKQIEAMKQVTALTKSLTAEEIKAQKLRQGEYERLQAAKQANNELNKSIQLRIKIRNAEEGSEIKLGLQHQKALGILKKLSEAQRQSVRGQALEKFANDVNDKLKAIEQRTGNFRRNVGNYANSLAGGFKSVADEIGKLQTKAQGLQDLSKSNPIGFQLAGGSDELNRTNAALQTLEKTQQIGFKTNQSYAVSVKQIEKAYQDMAVSGNFSEEFLTEFKKFAAEAKDNAADLRDEIKALSSDTRQLDLAVGTVSALASTFEAGVSAAALFGAETEEVQQITMKLVAVQGVANGIREVGEQITKRGTAANKAYNFVLQQGTILFGKGSTAAQRFGAALKGVLIFAAIGFLIKLVQYLTESGDGAAYAEKNLEKFNDQLERNSRILKGLDESAAFDFSSNLESLKKAGAERLKLAKNDKERAAIELQNRKNEFDLEVKFKEDQLKQLRVRQENANDDEIREFQRQNEYKRQLAARGRTDISKEEDAALKKQIKAVEDANAAAKDAVKKAQQDLNLFRQQNSTQQSQEEQQQQEQRQKEIEEMNDQEKKAALDLFIFRKNLIKDQADFEAGDEGLLGVNNKLKAAKKAADAETAIVEAQRKYDLSQEKLTTSERILIKEKAANDILKIETDLRYKLINIVEANVARERQLAEDSVAQFEQIQADKLQATKDADQKAFEDQQSRQQQFRDEQLKQNADNYVAGLKTKEEFEKRKAQIETDYERINLQNSITFFEQQLVELKKNGEDTIAVETALAAARAALAQGQIDIAKATRDREKEILAETKQNYIDAYSQIGEVFTNTLGAIAERRKQDLDDQIEKIDILKEKEIERVTKSSEAEETKAAKIKVIEANAQIQKDQADRKKRQIERQQAVFERSFKAFQVGTDTIVAVNKIKLLIASAPDPITKALYSSQLFLAITSGALALTSLLAQKLPGYYTGTDYSKEGPAHVAERGREIGIEPSGKVKLWTKPTIANLIKGTKILSNKVTEDVIASTGQDVVHPAIAFVETKSDNSNKEILWELQQIRKRSGISIHNTQGIESTAYYQHQMKQ